MSAAADPTPAPVPEPEPVQQPPAAQARPPRTGATGPRIPGIDKAQRVYVGNLAWSVSWQDLKDHMRMNGELNVNFCNVMGENGRSKVRHLGCRTAPLHLTNAHMPPTGMRTRRVRYCRASRDRSCKAPRHGACGAQNLRS